MGSLSLFLVALAGGILLAFLIRVAHRRRFGPQSDALAKGWDPARTDVINIASIRVAGVGGLGLVAMALTLAWAIPRIGQTVALGAALGVGLAVVLILWRRRFGPIPTSAGRMGANTTLAIDQPLNRENDDAPEREEKMSSAQGHAAV